MKCFPRPEASSGVHEEGGNVDMIDLSKKEEHLFSPSTRRRINKSDRKKQNLSRTILDRTVNGIEKRRFEKERETDETAS